MKVNQKSRKAQRKAARKEKKVLKNASYIKKNSKSEGGNSQSAKSATGKTGKNLSSLKKIIDQAKQEMKAKPPPKVKTINSLKKKESTSNGLTFNKSVDSRMAALQEYVNNEVKASGFKSDKGENTSKNEKKSTKKRKIKSLSSIRDENRHAELEKGMTWDDKEMKSMQRQLKLNAKQKKSANMLRNIFGSDIGDIFDVLKTEPTEADLLGEESTLASKRQESNKKKRKLELPENTIVVSTKSARFEQDEREDDDTPSSADCDSEDNVCLSSVENNLLNNNQKRIKKSTFRHISDSKDYDDSSAGILNTPQRLKSIIKDKKTPKRSNLNVSFNLGKNLIREIPLVCKIAGFTVYDQSDLTLPASASYDELNDSEQWEECDDLDMEESFSGSEDEEQIWQDMEEEFSSSDDDVPNTEEETKHLSTLTPTNVVKQNGKKGKKTGKTTEDIYGRLHDSSGNIIENNISNDGGYSSPATRSLDQQLQAQLNTDQLKRVRNQLRACLNRLAQVNLAGSVTMVREL